MQQLTKEVSSYLTHFWSRQIVDYFDHWGFQQKINKYTEQWQIAMAVCQCQKQVYGAAVYLCLSPLRRHCCARLDRTGTSGDEQPMS